MIFSETFFFGAAELIGTLAFAASGAMLAIDRHLDLLGVIVLGVTTALGGGVIRDVLLGILPPRMFSTVVFPAPLGPTITQNSPLSISKEILSAALIVTSPMR